MTNPSYFRDSVQWDGSADYEPFFEHTDELASLEAAPGVLLHPVFGTQMTLSYVTFAPNSIAPLHQHPQEQMTMVLQGRLDFEVGEEKKVMMVGDIVVIPRNVPHGAVAFEEGCIAIDVFAPPRDGFKELLQEE